MQSGTAVVIGDTGTTGTIAETLDDRTVLIRVGDELRDAQQVRYLKVQASDLQRMNDGRLHLPLEPDVLHREKGQTDRSGRIVVPVAEDQLHIGRRTVETGRVAVDKTVTEHEEIVDEPLIEEQAEVRRVPVNKIIDKPVDIREEGGELIIPLMEEVLVVEKRLMLREEMRISRKRSEHRDPKTYTLRREEAHVRRTPEHTNPQQDNPGKDSHHG